MNIGESIMKKRDELAGDHKPNGMDFLVARTQRNLTYLYYWLFAFALASLFFLPKPLEDSTKTLLITLLSVLGTLITQQSSFWMARNRMGGVPDPTGATTTTTTTPGAAVIQQTVTTAEQPKPATGE